MQTYQAQYPTLFEETWTPANWPGFPGGRRYRAALRAYERRFLPHSPRRSNRPMTPSQRRAASDTRIIHQMTQGYRKAQMYLDNFTFEDVMDPQNPDISPIIEDITCFVHTLANKTAIGIAIIHRHDPTTIETTAGILSRNRHWIGTFPPLCMLRGMDAIIFHDENHRVNAVVATPKEEMDPEVTMIPQCSLMKESLQNAESRMLDRIFRYHQATPHHLDMCAADQPYSAPETYTPTIFHNGRTEDWRN